MLMLQTDFLLILWILIATREAEPLRVVSDLFLHFFFMILVCFFSLFGTRSRAGPALLTLPFSLSAGGDRDWHKKDGPVSGV